MGLRGVLLTPTPGTAVSRGCLNGGFREVRMAAWGRKATAANRLRGEVRPQTH